MTLTLRNLRRKKFLYLSYTALLLLNYYLFRQLSKGGFGGANSVDDQGGGSAEEGGGGGGGGGSRAPDRLDLLMNAVDCEDVKSYQEEQLQDRMEDFLMEEAIVQRTADCDSYFKTVRPFIMDRSAAPNDFPMAFGHSLHHEVGVLELFLASFFHPQDSHCIHVDPKASPVVHKAVQGVVKCYKQRFPTTNLFLASHPIPVFWGHGSVLEADMICLRQLKSTNTEWKVWMNPASSELALMPLDRFRRTLKQAAAKGDVIEVEANKNKGRQKGAYRLLRTGPEEFDLKKFRVETYVKPPVPYNLTVLKGSKNVVLTRHTAHFITENPVALAFYDWLIDTDVPDEHFYATVNTITETHMINRHEWAVKQSLDVLRSSDGAAADGAAANDPRRPHGVCFRKTLWAGKPCHGRKINAICNFGVGDLELVRNTGCLMGNKFSPRAEASAIFCQIKWLSKATRDEEREEQSNKAADSAAVGA